MKVEITLTEEQLSKIGRLLMWTLCHQQQTNANKQRRAMLMTKRTYTTRFAQLTQEELDVLEIALDNWITSMSEDFEVEGELDFSGCDEPERVRAQYEAGLRLLEEFGEESHGNGN